MDIVCQPEPVVIDQFAGRWPDAEPLRVPKEVLVIEHDPDIRAILGFFLRSVGYQCSFLEDPITAADHINRERPPALVLLDRKLLGEDGESILFRIRTQTDWSETPVIVLSARNDLEEMTKLMQAGASGYLTKPFQAIQVVRMIDKFAR